QVQYITANQTMQLSDKLRTRIAFNNSYRKDDGLLPSQTGTDNLSTNFTKGTKFPNWALSGQADYVMSQTFFVGVRAGYFNSDQNDFNVPNVSRYIFQTSNTNVPGVPAAEIHGTGFSNVLSNNAVDHDKLTRTYVQADGTWYGNFAGSHELKGGVQ